jgi:hypothetical protein
LINVTISRLDSPSIPSVSGFTDSVMDSLMFTPDECL